MNLLTPKKVFKLNNVVVPETITRPNPLAPRVSLLTKIGIFLRWLSHLMSFCLLSLIVYISFFGIPPILKQVELQEIRQSLANNEDKVDVLKTIIDKIKSKK